MTQKLTKTRTPVPIESEDKLSMAIRAASEKKAIDPIALDLRGIASFADYLLICSGTSTRQVQAIADEVEETLRESGVRPLHIEGYQLAHWVLIDYGDIVVHVFEERTRAFYDLERLWRDANEVPIDGQSRDRS